MTAAKKTIRRLASDEGLNTASARAAHAKVEPVQPAQSVPPTATVRASPNIVTVRASGSIRVITEAIKDEGRERHENGSQTLAADEEGTFLVGAAQSLRIVGA